MTFILLDNTKDEDGASWLFEAPDRIIRADTPQDVPEALQKLEQALQHSLFVAGFFSFELAYVMEPCLAVLLPPDRRVPLLWFGVFAARQRLSRDEVDVFLDTKTGSSSPPSPLTPEWSQTEYARQFEKARQGIMAGEFYQLNLTFKTKFQYQGDPVTLYRELRRNQSVSYGAYIDAPEFKVLSLSPECFMHQTGSYIEARPMKGTAARAYLASADKAVAADLAADIKSQAENLMIVDLMRNDIGRIAQTGSVKTRCLFEVETYKTLHQMISTVCATLKPHIGIRELLNALFAPGSIVGAPKIQAMKAIHALESSPRGIYCGAIGMMGRDEKRFNVAIRTAVLIPDGDGAYSGEIGVGSGVVYDSSAASEYEECLLKTRFFTQAHQPFGLIETLRHDKAYGYVLLERHMLRLAESAAYFGITCDVPGIKQSLFEYALRFDCEHARIRVVLMPDGNVRMEGAPLPPDALIQIMRFVIAPSLMDSRNVHLYHKTTARDFIDDPTAQLKKTTGCDEVVFLNERGELTQGSYTNLFLEQEDGTFLTPPISAGLLPGTFRAEFMTTHKVVEITLYPENLRKAKQIYLGNSVRGLLKAQWMTGL